MLYQQGDVLLKSRKIPKSAKEVSPKGGRLILAEGEATGHKHAVRVDTKAQLYEHLGVLFLQTVVDTPLTHEEHGTIVIPKGEWEIGRVREYDHFEEESRQVAD